MEPIVPSTTSTTQVSMSRTMHHAPQAKITTMSFQIISNQAFIMQSLQLSYSTRVFPFPML